MKTMRKPHKMSKLKLKTLLASMDKADVISLVLELYSARKEVKEYLDFYAAQDESAKLEEYKRVIREEFYPAGRRREPGLRFSVCRKALSDFRKLKPSAGALAELMVFYMETACRFAYDKGDVWERYYKSVENNFDTTLRYLVLNDLWEDYDTRIRQCLRWAEPSGWEFSDALNDIYREMEAHNEMRRNYKNAAKPLRQPEGDGRE